MKTISLMIAAAALSLSACQSTTNASMDKAPTSVAAPLIGKTLALESGDSIILNADGTVGGQIRGGEVSGTYVATAKDLCSVYTSPDVLKGKEFCSVPKIDGDTVIFHRSNGTTSPTYNIQG